jgi:acetyltransferase-like isoleucine patch superfamily enzyme
LRRDHRPLFIKRLSHRYEVWYLNHFLRPQLESLGKEPTVMKPWCVEVNGGPIYVGDYANIVANSDNKVRLTVWSARQGEGCIRIGHYCILCAGVRISAATEISIGDNCMLANRVYVTDADWHDLYDRSMFVGQSAPVRIGNNVWLGDSAIVCKGVTIGENSVIGAGAVVVKDIPPNVVAAGNPAVVLKTLDQDRPIQTRENWFTIISQLTAEVREKERKDHQGNTFWGWLRSLIFPSPGD